MNWRNLIGGAAVALLCAGPAHGAVRVKVTTLPNGVKIENRKLTVTVTKGSAGPVVASKTKDGTPTRVELAVHGTGTAGKVGNVEMESAEQSEASVRFSTGTAEAALTLKAGQTFVEVKPGKGAVALETRAPARYAVLPDFFADDILYDPVERKPPVMAVPAENFLLQLLEDGGAIAMLVWEGTLESRMKPKPEESGTGKDPKVELLAGGEGEKRRFTAGRVEFLGKPVYAALLADKERIWNEVNIRNLPGMKRTPIAWKRPFDAKWRADFVFEGYDEKQVAAFLKIADETGLSKGYRGNLWPAHFKKDEKRDRGFWGIVVKSRSSRIEKKLKEGQRRSHRWNPGPFFFVEDETIVAPMEKWPHNDTHRINAARKKLGAEAEFFYPPHAFGRIIVYPIDRVESTPPSAYTVVDIMRNTLGEGPCEYVLDLDGLKLRKWLVTGKDGVMNEGGRTGQKIGICPLHNFIKRQVGPAIKKKEKLADDKLKIVLEMTEDLRLFMNTIWERNKEYRQWGKDFTKFCEEQGARSADVKTVAEKLAAIAQRIEDEMAKRGKLRFNVPKKRGVTGEEAIAYWNEAIPRVVEHFKSGEVDRYAKGLSILRGSETAYPPSGGVNPCGDEIDWMVVRLRRMVREIRHNAGAVETTEPGVAAFCSKVRRQCQAILRNKHQRETWGGDD